MKFLSALALVLSLGLAVGVSDAEAKRIGGGKSTGMQRQGTTEKAPTATPAQTPATPAAAAAPAGAAAGATAAAAAPKRSWMGPLAGIAAGLGIAALASHLGFGEELASMLMLGLLAFAVIAVIGLVMRKRAAAQGGQNGMAYAGASAGAGAQPSAPATRSFDTAMPAGGSSSTGSMIGANLAEPPKRSIPADFDVPAFVRNAKVQFIRLQAANDAGNLDDIRGFTTPEMFAELQMDLRERAGATQTTEVMTVEADVTDVTEEDQRYVVSVRFTGTLREDGAQTTSFDEVWHLTKPRQGNAGWVLAGIQQVQ